MQHDRHRDLLADLDELAESLAGYLVVSVVVDDDGHRRTYLYRSAAAAERCVARARARGRSAHVALVRLTPVGVVVGLRSGAVAANHAAPTEVTEGQVSADHEVRGTVTSAGVVSVGVGDGR